jgi:peptide-methionine (R)-S-oxide reductase
VSRKIEKAEEEWREQLSPEEYRVLREKGTERAFTGQYWNEKAAGTYVCAGCGAPLYDSNTKFDSGTGWPSFYEAVSPEAVATEADTTLGMRRTELLCSCCGGHLGHVFEDGPAPTGQRHCINSAALKLEPGGEK